MCHWQSCSHTEKAADRGQTMFEALRYLVKNTPDNGILGERLTLIKDLDAVIKLGEL